MALLQTCMPAYQHIFHAFTKLFIIFWIRSSCCRGQLRFLDVVASRRHSDVDILASIAAGHVPKALGRGKSTSPKIKILSISAEVLHVLIKWAHSTCACAHAQLTSAHDHMQGCRARGGTLEYGTTSRQCSSSLHCNWATIFTKGHTTRSNWPAGT